MILLVKIQIKVLADYYNKMMEKLTQKFLIHLLKFLKIIFRKILMGFLILNKIIFYMMLIYKKKIIKDKILIFKIIYQ